jgi:hypothetical protein
VSFYTQQRKLLRDGQQADLVYISMGLHLLHLGRIRPFETPEISLLYEQSVFNTLRSISTQVGRCSRV